MYDFHYNVMRRKYPLHINLLYTDTDSFFYEILTEDFYNDILNYEFKEYFDTFNYPTNRDCHFTFNKKVLGKFKDECKGEVIHEFIGLRPKLYCFTIVQKYKNVVKKKSKGIVKSIVEKEITFEDYKKSLFSNEILRKQMQVFKSKKHVIETLRINKVALNCNDDKRHICENGINTVAYGHKDIKCYDKET